MFQRQVDPNGNWLDVVVPKEAQNGQINVEVNGQNLIKCL